MFAEASVALHIYHHSVGTFFNNYNSIGVVFFRLFWLRIIKINFWNGYCLHFVWNPTKRVRKSACRESHNFLLLIVHENISVFFSLFFLTMNVERKYIEKSTSTSKMTLVKHNKKLILKWWKLDAIYKSDESFGALLKSNSWWASNTENDMKNKVISSNLDDLRRRPSNKWHQSHWLSTRVRFFITHLSDPLYRKTPKTK